MARRHFPWKCILTIWIYYPNRFIHGIGTELEFVYVLEGAIEFQTGVGTYVLSGGQGGLVPSNMLHMVSPYHRQRGSIYCAVLFERLSAPRSFRRID